ncbi:hypothetical protein ACTFIW_012736 [Dictyostelium discoideum]
MIFPLSRLFAAKRIPKYLLKRGVFLIAVIIVIISNTFLFCKLRDIDFPFVLFNRIGYMINGENKVFDEHTIYNYFQSKPIELTEKEKRIKQIVLSRECEYVDLVYTWVNGSDPKHIDSHKKTRMSLQADDISVNRYIPSSFRDLNTLKYSLRSVKQYAPWIKNIFIITANQIPTWFDIENSENVKFISHSDYFHKKSDLPTFNSNSIESNFWNLPIEVSNCFLYLNDDIFFSRPVKQSDYFDENKNFRQSVFLTEYLMGRKAYFLDLYDQYSKAILFSNRALASIWGQDRKRSIPAHGIQVFNRKIWYKMQEEFGAGLEITSSNKFRNITDFQISHLYIQFALRYSKPIIGSDDVLYIQLNNENFDEKLEILKNSRNETNSICLNDGLEFINDDLQKKSDDNFNFLFPNKSSFEK